MRYKFSDILNENIYKTCRVMISVGKYELFNNLVAGTLKGMCIDNKIIVDMKNIVRDFEDDDYIEDEEEAGEEHYTSSLKIDDFFTMANQPCLEGKWYCRAQLSALTSKQKEKLFTYLKSPSETGVLVLTATDFKDYKEFLKNKLITNSRYVHMFQLSYPTKRELSKIITNMFMEKNISIDKEAIELFELKMSTRYDLYQETIEFICEQAASELRLSIDVDVLKEYMKGIEHFDMSDLIYEILKPITSKKNVKRKIKVLYYLQEKYEPEYLVNMLIKYIDKMIDYRILINKGYIPININYIYKDVLKAIQKIDYYKDKYKDTNEWVFRKEAAEASKTTLQDWTYIRMILQKASKVGYKDSKIRTQACERALYDIVIRSKINTSRLNNIIGMEDILGTNALSNLDKLRLPNKNIKTKE